MVLSHLLPRLVRQSPAHKGRNRKVVLDDLGAYDLGIARLGVEGDFDIARGVVGHEDGVEHACDEARIILVSAT